MTSAPAAAAPANRRTLVRLGRVLHRFLTSEAKAKAWWWIGSLMTLMLCINGMNVLNSFVGRDFMSAIELRDRAGFVRYAWTYAGVFALSTLVAVWFRFSEERLALLWRDWLTRRALHLYLSRRTYLHLKESGNMSNPDQRIAEDIKSLTVSTVSFLLMIVNGTVTTLSFAGVLWSISPKLFVVAVLYAAAGSGLTILLGRPLVRLNYQQSDREADLRSELIRVSDNADGIASTRCEPGLRRLLASRMDAVVGNLRRIIAVNRNLSFFTTGYNYLIQLIPTLLVAPLFIDGKVEFGIIGQSAMAFSTLLGAFSLVVTQFQAISSYASVTTRLGEFTDAMEQQLVRTAASLNQPDEAMDSISFEKLSLFQEAEGEAPVLRALEGTIRPGRNCLVTGPNETAKQLLFRAAADLHHAGSGIIRRPPAGRIGFLPEQPYLPPVPLRQLLDPAPGGEPPDERILLAAVGEAGLSGALARHGGLDVARDWDSVLSFAERQLLAVARLALLKPAFVFLDHPESALDEEGHRRAMEMLDRRGITRVTIAGEDACPADHDLVLEFLCDGSWRWQDLRQAAPTNPPQ